MFTKLPPMYSIKQYYTSCSKVFNVVWGLHTNRLMIMGLEMQDDFQCLSVVTLALHNHKEYVHQVLTDVESNDNI